MTRVLVVVFVLLFCVAGVRAQNVDQDDVIRVESELTNLPLTVTDKERRFVTTFGRSRSRF